jgi:hypothetical protein
MMPPLDGTAERANVLVYSKRFLTEPAELISLALGNDLFALPTGISQFGET